MEHQRHVHRRVDLRQAVQIQLRRGLVDPVLGADGHRQEVRVGLLDEVARVAGIGVGHLVHLARIVGQSAHAAQLALQAHAHGVAGACQLRGVAYVVRVILLAGAVVHHRAEAPAQRLHDDLVAVAVIQMHRHRNLRSTRGLQHHRRDHVEGAVLQQHLRRADDHRGGAFLGGADHRAHHVRVEGIEKSHAVLLLLRVLEQFFHRIECHKTSIPFRLRENASISVDIIMICCVKFKSKGVKFRRIGIAKGRQTRYNRLGKPKNNAFD